MGKQVSGPSRFAYRRTEKVVAKLEHAKKKMLEEINCNEGIYPHNRGAITQAELCRRAGISQATLQNPTHKNTTLVDVNKWLTKVRESAITGLASVRAAVTSRADQWKIKYQCLATNYNVSRLEVVDLKEQLATAAEQFAQAQTYITQLEAENQALRTELSQGRVVRLPSSQTSNGPHRTKRK